MERRHGWSICSETGAELAQPRGGQTPSLQEGKFPEAFSALVFVCYCVIDMPNDEPFMNSTPAR